VSDAEIVIGLTVPMSGPAAIHGNLAVAKEAWARYVDDLGGVPGRKLRVAIKDDGFNPGRAAANVKEMRDSVFLTVDRVGSAVVNASANPQLWARQSKDKLRSLFIDYPDYADEADYLVTYSVTKLGAQKATDLSYVQVAPYQVFKPLF